MYDSVTSADIPLGALVVAGYVDGLDAWSEADWARHAKAAQVRIAISRNTIDADVLDVETGDETEGGALVWVLAKRNRGEPSVVYIQESRWAYLRAVFANAGQPPPPVWLAWWDGVATIPAGAFAKQYANPTLSHGHYDLSVVPDYWGGVDPPPTVAPPPPQPGLPEHEVALAWADLGDVLGNSLVSLVNRVAVAGSGLGDF